MMTHDSLNVAHSFQYMCRSASVAKIVQNNNMNETEIFAFNSKYFEIQ